MSRIRSLGKSWCRRMMSSMGREALLGVFGCDCLEVGGVLYSIIPLIMCAGCRVGLGLFGWVDLISRWTDCSLCYCALH